MICPNCFNESVQGNICPNCGYNIAEERRSEKALPAFTILRGRYRLGRVLGRGGFGITYVAHDLMTGRLVAVKECFPDSYAVRSGNVVYPKPDNDLQYNGCLRCFRDEIYALQQLRNNPSVVNFVDTFSEYNTEYLVMEYIEGATLKYLTAKNNGTLSFGNCIYVILMIGSALIDIHQRGILHRDISPENIMVSSDGSIKLIDFGACKILSSGIPDEAVFLKQGFAPPEQYSIDGMQGPWTDVYALGATLYTIISGQPLIDAPTRQERDTMKPLAMLECGIPENLSDAVSRSMALDMSNRFSSVEQFFGAINAYVPFADGIDNDLMMHVIKYRTTEHRKTDNGHSVYSDIAYPYVVVMSGRSQGKKVKIPDYGFISIGKDVKIADLPLDDSNGISRRHCIVGFDRSKNRFIVIDRSTNGTFYSNGLRMMLDAETYLDNGDEFFVVSSNFRLKVIFE